MRDLFYLEITLFVLVAIGYGFRKGGLVGAEGQKNMTDLVLNLLLPCTILNSFNNGAGPETLKECAAVMLVSCGVLAFSYVFGRVVFRNMPADERVNLNYGTICSNCTFLGNPVAESAYGAMGLMYASVFVIPVRIVMWSEGIATYSGERSLKAAVKKVLGHPCIICCEVGILMLATGFRLPEVLASPVLALAKCNTGISMLVVGMILAGADLRTLLEKSVVVFTFCRLVIIPLGVYLGCLLIPMSATVRGVCVLLAAMPAGTTTSMLAAKYNRKPEYASKLVMLSTLCSLPAALLWCAILK